MDDIKAIDVMNYPFDPPAIIKFMNSRGQKKCLFGTNGLGLARCKDMLMDMDLKDTTKQAVLRDNAVRVFKLDE